MGEANLPAQEAKTNAYSRIPGPHVHPGGPGCDQEPSAERPAPAGRLIWRVRDRGTLRALSAAPRLRRGPLSLAVVTSRKATPPRVAYAVGRRVGGAVARNRVRRRLRAAARNHVCELQPGAAYLFGAASGAAALGFDELDTTVRTLLVEARRPRSAKALR